MDKRNLEVKILLYLCLIFWIFQSIDDSIRLAFMLFFGGLLFITVIFANRVKINIKPYIFAGYIQWVALFALMVFSYIKAEAKINLNVVRISAVVLIILSICVFIPLCIMKKKQIAAFYKKIDGTKSVYAVMFAGFLLRQFQIFNTLVTQLQNDCGSFNDGSMGHLGYIYKVYKHTELPKGNPMEQYQFYQPPLNHIVMGVWAKINGLFGLSEEVIAENLQVLALFFSTMIIIVAYKIMKEFTNNKKGIFTAVVLVSFFPYMLEYAGAINNDTLCTLLSLMTVLYMIRWYKKSSWKNILLSGLCIGLAMMTKVSAVMLAPAMAFVFIYKLIREKTNWLYYIKQYLAFGIVSIPLGIWFPLKNLILYHVPLNFVPVIGPEQGQYMGGMYSVFDRLFKVTWDQLYPLFLPQMRTMKEFTYNIWIMLTKYCAFGETRYFSTTQYAKFIGAIMYLLILILVVFAVMLFIIWIKKSKKPKAFKGFISAGILLFLISYIKFCFDYPCVCTASVRYVLVSVVLIFCVMGAGVEYVKNSRNTMILRNIFKCFLTAYVVVNTLGLISLVYNI